METLSVQSTADRPEEEIARKLGPYHYLYTILEETPNGVVVIGLNHRIVHANPAARRFLDIPDKAFEGLTLQEVLGQNNRTLLNVILEAFAAPPGKFKKIRHEMEVTENGERSILDAVIVYPPASPDYYLLYLIDITQQKKLEGELRRRNAFFHNLIDSSVDGIIAADMKGNIMLFNKGAQELLGYDEQTSLQLHVTGLYREGALMN
ncbi:hypothetical protein DGMP_38680 [Desulfomarina profundi]|uniref:PAS domain-containing protein n=1 Tax=Desulfomarina profundi TaxID=2772557 RepID=A0A8D5FLJ5_9BACT|nr:PAS domain-containing protein [Desulfomarina profundi]BCL63175.1 hypothetical protein DGMP_38680 [Desulfomarina profundi]